MLSPRERENNPHNKSMTPEQYQQFLQNCDYSVAAIQTLINNEYTAQKFTEGVQIRMMSDPSNISTFFSRYFEVQTFPDGVGDTIQSTIYAPPRIISAFNRFQYDDQWCDDDRDDLTRCMWCYEDIPTGGTFHVTTRMLRNGAKTDPICLETLRSRDKFNWYLERHLEDRYRFEDQRNSDFYWLTLLRTAGHKITLQIGGHPLANVNLDSPLPEFPSTFISDFFPPITNPNNVIPLQKNLLLNLSQSLQYRKDFESAIVARGPQGEPIYQMIVDTDIWMTLVDQDPDQVERAKYSMPEKLFMGYNAGAKDMEGERMILWGFAFKQMINMPRFARNAITGGVLMVPPFINVPTENGTKPVANPDWINAPYGLAIIPSPEQAIVMGRPAINIPGVPLTMLEGENEWLFWNKYDKECNPDENIFYFKHRWRKGYMPKKPWAAAAFLVRRLGISNQYSVPCNALDDFCIQPYAGCVNSSLLDGGCDFAGRPAVEADITEPMINASKIQCAAELCGDADSTIWKIKIPMVSGRVGGVIPVECGGSVLVGLVDEDGDPVDPQIATLLDNSMAGTRYASQGIYYIEFAAALTEGYCPTWVEAVDASPNAGVIVDCYDGESEGCEDFSAGEFRFYVAGGPLSNAEIGTTGTVTFNNAATAAITISGVDHPNLSYTAVFTNTALNCASNGGLASLTVTP